jgi:hypothetical protein
MNVLERADEYECCQSPFNFPFFASLSFSSQPHPSPSLSSPPYPPLLILPSLFSPPYSPLLILPSLFSPPFLPSLFSLPHPSLLIPPRTSATSPCTHAHTRAQGQLIRDHPLCLYDIYLSPKKTPIGVSTSPASAAHGHPAYSLKLGDSASAGTE